MSRSRWLVVGLISALVSGGAFAQTLTQTQAPTSPSQLGTLSRPGEPTRATPAHETPTQKSAETRKSERRAVAHKPDNRKLAGVPPTIGAGRNPHAVKAAAGAAAGVATTAAPAANAAPAKPVAPPNTTVAPTSPTLGPPAPTPAPVPTDKGSVTGLPLPRWASLRTDDVNLRAGPGTRYPIDWIYKRRDLPVKIEREFEVWRLVEDEDGIKGWVHQATLIGRRSFLVTGADQTMRSAASDTATPVAILKPGVVGRLRSCDAASDWCQVQVGDYTGWLRREQFWGTSPGEAIQP